jgi:osmotically-inducible protein OsmY
LRILGTTLAVVLSGLLGLALSSCASRIQERDDRISRAVKQVLYDHEPVNLLHVEVSVSRRVVYLAGEVDEYGHKEEAERVSKGVDGVVDVVNKVQVEP